jgi:hypothetical protein
MHRIFLAALLSVLCTVVSLSPCQAQPPSSCRVAKWGLNHTRATETLVDLAKARAALEAYDTLLRAVPQAERDPGFMYKMTKLRCGIIEDALTSYFFLGAIKLTEYSDEQLYVQLMQADMDYCSNYAMPDTLTQLVDYGYLPHLPASAYPTGQWLTSAPQIAPEPGSVLYLPIAAQTARMALKPGMNEGWLLMAFGDVDDQLLSKDRLLDGRFFGKLEATLNPLPTTATYLWGQDVNTIE